MTVVGVLPASSKPWQMQSFGNVIVLANEEHPPMIIAEGRLQLLELEHRPRSPATAPRYYASFNGAGFDPG